MKRLTKEEWLKEGRALFGLSFRDWRFVCPVCGNVAAIGDYEAYKEQGATPESATKECIGRYRPGGKRAFGDDPGGGGGSGGPCDYAGYGLLRLSPVTVTFEDGAEVQSFAFDESLRRE